METNQKIKILLVDDRKENLSSLEAILAKQEYAFILANSGSEALKILLTQHDFALILMDIKMPIMDGFETAQLIRRKDYLKHIPIIFITAMQKTPENIFQGYLSGAVDYIVKPIVPEILKAKVAVFADLYSMSKELIVQGELLKAINSELSKRTEDLLLVNKELESFSYSVSHDLRTPLRAVNGYAQMLNEDYGTKLDAEGKRIIETIRYNAVKMGTLIDELLAFSQIGRKELQKAEIDMNKLTKEVLAELNISNTHTAKINFSKLHKVKADYGLLKQVMFNLISNAVKYSSKKEHPLVEIYSEEKKNEIVFFVKDNGTGFDMKYYDKLFGVFQRLHKQNEFEGVGVGLAIIQRIIVKHGGKVWAKGKVNEGATFNFSLTIN